MAAICLSCRTLLRDGGRCEGKKHHTVSLTSAKGRRALDDEVWGPDSRARTMRKMAKAGATGGGAGGLFQGCGSGCDGLDGCGGRTLRVPEGRVHLVAKKREDDVEGSRLREWLVEVGAKRVEEERDLFPYDLARSLTLAPGDRVEVLGDVELTSDAAQEQGYRVNAAIVAPIGVPVLRVKRDEPRARVAGPPLPPDVEEDEPESERRARGA